VLLGIAWALWAAGWIRRVELRHGLEPMIGALGLTWLPQGLRARVTASGEVEGRLIVLRGERRGGETVVTIRVGTGAWARVDADSEVVRAAVRGV